VRYRQACNEARYLLFGVALLGAVGEFQATDYAVSGRDEDGARCEWMPKNVVDCGPGVHDLDAFPVFRRMANLQKENIRRVLFWCL
jgi:hypothetical protein